MNKLKQITILFFLPFLLIGGSLYAQQSVPGALKKDRWFDKQTVEIFGHHIMRVFGEAYDRTAYPTDKVPLTNAGFKTYAQLVQDLRDQAKANNWDSDQLKTKLNELGTTSAGGRVYVYIQRMTNDKANGKYFFVELRDTTDKVLLHKNIGYQSPEFGDFDMWANLFTIDLPKRPEYPFYIYVSDRNISSLPEFKFEVQD